MPQRTVICVGRLIVKFVPYCGAPSGWDELQICLLVSASESK